MTKPSRDLVSPLLPVQAVAMFPPPGRRAGAQGVSHLTKLTAQATGQRRCGARFLLCWPLGLWVGVALDRPPACLQRPQQPRGPHQLLRVPQGQAGGPGRGIKCNSAPDLSCCPRQQQLRPQNQRTDLRLFIFPSRSQSPGKQAGQGGPWAWNPGAGAGLPSGPAGMGRWAGRPQGG